MSLHQFEECDRVPLEFDDQSEEVFFKDFIELGPIYLHNGYLSVKTQTGTIFFHRFLWEILTETKIGNKQIHHKNHNKWDNRMDNLQVMEPNTHKKYHERKRTSRYSKGLQTYSEKKYGCYPDDEIEEEFRSWLMNKGQWVPENGEQYYDDW